ncbi:MAG: tetratricopeptide repeat protein [Parcubacteria group bacterium]
MRAHLALTAVLPLALLGACATVPKTPAERAAALAPDQSSYGLFLAGEGALHDGRSADATDYFMRASQGGAFDGGFLKDRAFTAAVLAGDITKAASWAPAVPEGHDATYQLGLLVRAVDMIAQGRGKDARPLLAPDALGFPHRAAGALLAPWAAAAAGDTQGSLERPQVAGDKVVEYFGQLGQALLFERARRYDEAETDFKALAGATELGDLFTLDYGGFLERRGRAKEALALYNDALAQEPDDRELTVARDRAASGGKPPALPTVQQGAARAMMAPAAAMLAEKQGELALAYLRMAIRLDSQRYDAWLLVGDILGGLDDIEASRQAYNMVPPTSPEFSNARSKLAWSYQTAGDKDTALRLAAEAVAADPNDRDAAITQADLLRVNDRYAEAATVLDRLIAQEGDKPDWRLLYMRGVALERSGHWPDAEKDLTRALAQQPDQPELLNYLGYSWIDRGERLSEALDMVRRASEADPHSGAMVDSLGWAYFRLGEYGKAVEKLERAVELEPADPEINNHLGDAYWRVGRRTEAKFQWERVLTLQPDPAIKQEVESKLKSGLGAPPPVPGRVVANSG